jgi:hypothetical protein
VKWMLILLVLVTLLATVTGFASGIKQARVHTLRKSPVATSVGNGTNLVYKGSSDCLPDFWQ